MTPKIPNDKKSDASRPPLLRPHAIVKGDTIGVVSPSYAPKSAWLQRGVRALERWIQRCRPRDRNAATPHAGEDERRAENSWACGSTPVKAIIASTGGYGAVRYCRSRAGSLPQNPKALVGYSTSRRSISGSCVARICGPFTGLRLTISPSVRDPTMASLITALTVPAPETDRTRSARAVVPGRSGAGSSAGICRSFSRRSAPTTGSTCRAQFFAEETRDPMSFVDERLVHPAPRPARRSRRHRVGQPRSIARKKTSSRIFSDPYRSRCSG